MLNTPVLYGVSADYQQEDPRLLQYRTDLVHSAAVALEKASMIRYNRKTGAFQSTDIGRIARYLSLPRRVGEILNPCSSHYYVNSRSMTTYNTHLRSSSGLIELLRTFSLSEEFSVSCSLCVPETVIEVIQVHPGTGRGKGRAHEAFGKSTYPSQRID